MAKRPPTPEKLFDQMWRPGRPFRPRVSTLRRIAMGLLLIVLLIVIVGYVYLTDEVRLRHMAENYLGTLVGGPVKIGKAKLSIFQGLQLDDVALYDGDPKLPDSLLFTAHSFLLEYSAKALLIGNLEATRIVAVEPRVYVTEDADTGRRNYAKLLERHRATSMPAAPAGKIPQLPEIVLRNAQLTYTRQRDGQIVERNSIALEGQLTPIIANRQYSFSFQSHGSGSDVGPMMAGTVSTDTGQISARLSNFEFGPDIKAMLPPDVRRWWEEHDLSGRVNVPILNITMASGRSGTPGYRVETELEGVTLSVRPQEWLSGQEQKQLQAVRANFTALKSAGIAATPFVDSLQTLVEPTSIKLTQVHGKFIFNDDQSIGIEGLRGWLAEVPFQVDGAIKGYSAAAAATLHIASAEGHEVTIPESPGYLTSLPPPVRELYDRFRPRGNCRFWIDVDRPGDGAGKPSVTGEIDILDGHFVFERFPYPLDGVAGKIKLGKDAASGWDSITLDHLTGHGPPNSVNAASPLALNGKIAPLGPESQVDLIVRGTGITADAQLVGAFPPVTRHAIGIFSGLGTAALPDFSGGFECHILRDYGIESHWTIDTDVHLAHAAGKFNPFPYPIDSATGDLKVRDDHIELVNIELHHDTTDAKLDGVVSWKAGTLQPGEEPDVREKIHIAAQDLAWDRDLMNALPASKRPWLTRLGGTGRLSVDGMIDGPTPSNDVGLNLDLVLADGTAWPIDGQPAVSDLDGHFHLSDDQLTITDAHGKRGASPLSARGQIRFPGAQPSFAIDADAKELVFDPALYALIPADAQAGWTQINPAGTGDVWLNYSSDAAGKNNVGLTIAPRAMSATPAAAPYRLDNLTGSLKVEGDQVTISDVTARHGNASVQLSGAGNMTTAAEPAGWRFKLAADSVPIDEDLDRALPGSVADFVRSMKVNGNLGFSFSNLTVRSHAATTRGSDDPDIDFALTLNTPAANLDVGVPLQNVKGSADLNGTARSGRLSTLGGSFSGETMNVGGRQINQFHADLLKPADHDQITIGRIQAEMAGGNLAGQIDYAFPQRGPSRYGLNLVLQNADVKQLTGETDQPINGMLSASLGLEGIYDKPGSRRGRGDVTVTGQKMYKIPVLLGLLQVTNLALPINEPFTEATARYGIEGNRVTFEDIELRARDMMMQGDGNLDFASKAVKLNFVTDSQNWSKVPLIGPVLEGARHELLQIHVKGTLQEPQVSAGSLYTLTTTVDQVINGDDATRPPKAKSRTP